MKKAMLYVLALCICLTMAGCRREVLPAGEVDESQAGMVTMATATQNAVLYVEDYDETAIGYYKFFKELHWLEGGFHIWHSSGTADPDLAYTPNQELMAKVQMINVPLNDSVS